MRSLAYGLRGFHHWRFETLIVLSVIELHVGLVYLSAVFMITVVVPLSAFLRFIAGLFFNSFRALTSLRDRLFLGSVILISASCVLTFSK